MKKLPNAKWLTLEEAVKRRRQLKTDGRSLVITNGAFDLLHPGHLYYLQKASDLADQLWILLNSDESVKMLKGPNRPLQNEAKRANALAALEFVDSIITFQAMRLTAEIEALSPDIYVLSGPRRRLRSSWRCAAGRRPPRHCRVGASGRTSRGTRRAAQQGRIDATAKSQS